MKTGLGEFRIETGGRAIGKEEIVTIFFLLGSSEVFSVLFSVHTELRTRRQVLWLRSVGLYDTEY